MPKRQQGKPVLSDISSEALEASFYQSLAQLATHFALHPMETRSYGYPDNISLALWDIQRQLQGKVSDWDNLYLIKDKGSVYVQTEQRYHTHTTLFYIPVIPLYRMLKDRKRKPAANLLLNVARYLYQHAAIPYYRSEDSYLYNHYQILAEYMEEEDGKDRLEYACHLRQAAWVGDHMLKKLQHPNSLQKFGQELQRFKVKDGYDKACQRIAANALTLYQQYPHASYDRNRGYFNDSEQEADEDGLLADEIIPMESYVSFFANDKGILFHELQAAVNSEINELGGIEEPVIIKNFNGHPVTGNNLDFEQRLFDLIQDYCYVLNEY